MSKRDEALIKSWARAFFATVDGFSMGAMVPHTVCEECESDKVFKKEDVEAAKAITTEESKGWGGYHN